tara:strand:+ start:114 stop:1067 length:954 start_codon:yes stop_codon:yes gene_type:complete
MAVFTKLNRNEIENYLKSYEIGNLEKYNEIIEGIENTNYKITCNGIPYILTIFEKRVRDEDLPFFIDLKLFLNKKNFKCPLPIKNKNGDIINEIKNKKAVIISFIEGNKLEIPNKKECNEIGIMIGNLHKITTNFDKKRENTLDIKEWKKLFNKFENNKDEKFEPIIKELKKEINFLEISWPDKLPSGIIHADLFKDNIFFKDEKISGVIDFYFSCYHFFLYDISLVINDWCFVDNGKTFKDEYYQSIIEGYNTVRSIINDEWKIFNILLRAAAVRILVTRLHDYIFHQEDAIVVKKDPFQYYNILKWHQNNSVLEI